MTLSLADARTLADGVLAAAVARHLNVACCVLDDAGRELVSLRMDSAGGITSGIARSKARTAAVMSRDTEEVAELAERVPDVLALANEQVAFRLTTLRGGIVVRVNDQIVGAIGVSGASSQEDVELAQAAVAAWSAAL